MRYFVNGCVHYAKKMKKNHYQLKSSLFFCIVLFFCESSQCEMKICGDNHGIFKTIKQLKMKTILNLKQYVILLVAAFAMTSCLDSDDPDFQVVGGGYIIQVNNTSTPSFFPMVTISANEPMSGGGQVSNGKTNVSLKDIEGYAKQAVQTDASTQILLAKELTEVTGQYTIKAVNGAGEAAESWFSLSASKGMGALESKIECGDDGKITAYFKLAEEADYYYIFLQKDSYDLSKYGSKYWSETDLKKVEPEMNGQYEGYYKLVLNVSDLLSSSSTELASGRYKVIAAAAITGTNYTNFLVLQEGDYDTYTK